MGRKDQPAAGHGKWLALTAALLGWLFDGAEMGVFSMVGRPAIEDLLAKPDEATINLWFGVILASFLVGAATGGVVFGWLGDRIGRVRAMALSILTYSVFSGLCGFAHRAELLGGLRFIASLGMGGEWSLGVALVMEVWPNRSRAFMAGLIGAAANVGYMLVGVVGLALAAVIGGLGRALVSAGVSDETVAWLSAHQGWRLMMIAGAVPALLTFFIRLWVPESARWQEEKERGGTTGWATYDLLAVLLGTAGPALIIYVWAWDGPEWMPNTLAVRLTGTILGLLIVTVGYTYPVLRYLQRHGTATGDHNTLRPTLRRMLLAACLSGVALLGTWGSAQWAAAWAYKLSDGAGHAKEYTQIALAVGACFGTIAAALMGDWFGRRPAYCLLCLASLGSVFLFYQGNTAYLGHEVQFLSTAIVIGATTASFYGWLPLYLPELFPTRVRATGQGFGFNFGRILAAVGTLQTGVLFRTDIRLGDHVFKAGYPSACSLISLIYLVGVAIIWLAPETRGQPLPE